MKRSRALYFHEEANARKILALEALHAAYNAYLKTCVDALIAARAPSLQRGQYSTYFTPNEGLTTNIVTSIHNHAVEIVKAWFVSAYSRLVKSKIKALAKDGAIDDAQRIQLFTIGKYAVAAPTELISQGAIDQYWTLLLAASNPPTVSKRIGMRLSVQTGRVKLLDLELTQWWLSLSSLTKSKTLRFPLKPNPFLRDPKEVQNGCLVRKDKRGRWRVEVLETKLPEAVPALPASAPRVGVDVGLNVLAATSDGRLYGSAVKPRFDRRHKQVKTLRANRQRQGFKENSKRLNVLEDSLSGLIKTETGRVANQLIKDYPGHVFVIEDLDLNGCRGQKRFAYRALHNALTKKANVQVVNPAYTSQQCPSCGHVARNNRSGIRFKCKGCGKICHADVVGGKNLLGRSEDKGILLDDDPIRVKKILGERYLLRRSSSSESKEALLAYSQELTVGVLSKDEPSIAPNAEGKS